MSRKELDAAWRVFRLTLRDTALQFSKSYASRVNSIPLEAVDPERVAPLVHGVVGELDQMSTAGEASPVLRALKRALKPTEAERSRKRLATAFEQYAKAWNAQTGA